MNAPDLDPLPAPVPAPGAGQDPARPREFGPQPIDRIMRELSLENHAVVAASDEQLTHKMVAKARRGRWLTPAVRHKVCRALNRLLQRSYTIRDLFDYR